MKFSIALLLIPLTFSAGTDDDATMQQSRTGRVMLQQNFRDVGDKDQDVDVDDKDRRMAKSGKGGNSGKGGTSSGGGGGSCSPNSCVGCYGCTLTACKESESCCNHYKDLQNRVNDVKQNYQSRIATQGTCDKQLESLFQETSQKMKTIGGCSSMSHKSPCMKCFACRSTELNFCQEYKDKKLDCDDVSLISENGSLQGSDEIAPPEGSENIALVSRAAVREGDHIETTESVFRSKNCL